MTYPLLKFAHIIGLVLIGGGLIGVWLSDLRSRQMREPVLFAEATRNIAIFYDGVVVPGALLLLFSGAWMTVVFYGGWDFLNIPWLAGMIFLFAFEFVEGNTITRLYFMRLRRIARAAVSAGHFTPELDHERARLVPTFTHFLDLPILVLIIALGVMRPAAWDFFVTGLIAAIVAAFALTAVMRRVYKWES
ncbi:MAG TPA: DUF2269 domain-containing protein [Syntrophales bacterium]|nr:MAG: hypothetical protein A2052_07660 [Deltaproteobacteria bacterium GWA2_54_12]HLE18807.1 DUF2269 domain-containing protein [Syntrophales bacterium]